MKIDYTFHSHTYRCGHAVGDIEDYVVRAINYGMKIYGVSDHALLPGIHQGTGVRDFALFDDYVKQYFKSKSKHENEIKMFLGFECEYSEVFLDYYKSLLSEKGFDYLICGQHFGFDENKNIYSYSGRKEDVIRYKNDLIKAMKSGLFLYIAHPDFFFLFFTEVNDFAKEITKEIIDAAIKYDAVFEVNRHGLLRNRFRDGKLFIDYPSDYFWKEVSKTNIKVVVGGDFHDPNEIGDEQLEKGISDFVERNHLKLSDIEDVYNEYLTKRKF